MSYLTKGHDQEQHGEERVCLTHFHTTVRHQRTSGAGGRNWSRSHGRVLFSGLSLPPGLHSCSCPFAVVSFRCTGRGADTYLVTPWCNCIVYLVRHFSLSPHLTLHMTFHRQPAVVWHLREMELIFSTSRGVISGGGSVWKTTSSSSLQYGAHKSTIYLAASCHWPDIKVFCLYFKSILQI